MKRLSCEHLSGRLRCICEGSDEDGHPIDMTPEKRLAYLKNVFPSESMEVLIGHVQDQTPGVRRVGLGDVVAAGIKLVTAGLVKPCIPCNKRKERWNEFSLKSLIPFLSPRQVDMSTRRNLIMHVWPTLNGAWKWNIDQLIQRRDVFTGSVTIGVAESPGVASADEVREYASPLGAEVFSVPNNPRIREGATFQRLLQSVKDDTDGVTFFCHSKGARHGESFGSDGSTLIPWTETMYRTCLDDIHGIVGQLKNSAMTGPFRRFGNFKTPGNNRWHYSGAFYWFRNADVFDRNWQKMDMFFFAVESWPGLLFRAEEVACCFHDDCGDLYQKTYWETEVLPKLEVRYAT